MFRIVINTGKYRSPELKYTYKNTCPCNDYEFKLIYISDRDEVTDFYCPFCGIAIDETPELDEEDDD